mgnify:CR=1 FL=1
MDLKMTMKNGMILIVDPLGNHQINHMVQAEKSGKVSEVKYCGYYPSFKSLLKAFGTKRVGKTLSGSGKKEITAVLEQFAIAEESMKALADEIGEILDEKRREIDEKEA